MHRGIWTYAHMCICVCVCVKSVSVRKMLMALTAGIVSTLGYWVVDSICIYFLDPNILSSEPLSWGVSDRWLWVSSKGLWLVTSSITANQSPLLTMVIYASRTDAKVHRAGWAAEGHGPGDHSESPVCSKGKSGSPHWKQVGEEGYYHIMVSFIKQLFTVVKN